MRRKNFQVRSRATAFSLVELVVVVVIIGTIAAIAVPRLSRGAGGAGASSLRASLAVMRSALDRYAAEHGGVYPGTDSNEVQFREQLTKKTNALGDVGDSPPFIYGPYLQRVPPVGVGPNRGATGVIITTEQPMTNALDESSTAYGWLYNFNIGEILANTNDLDDNGLAFHQY